ncbi:Zinc finger protein ZPR1 [Armadillidium nasatum]|uniref:Zinc finger protein ZPR1 n=1 Tax=Armadillidium nasatum TaxID=96803 RepID=A0A5N5TEA1_9CRUS|nr:Zinc finger protein ZPR1 [Armadillidium nasatum]
MSTSEPIYKELTSETENPDVLQIESLCMKCNGKGTTKLLLTKIPHYKEIIITSFECFDCGDKNNGIQSSSFHEFGVKYELNVMSTEDLSRQIVKSDEATISIPELDFEIPSNRQRGEINTIEGIVRNAIDGLSQDQETRKVLDVDLYEKIQHFIEKLEELLKVKCPFTLILNDPSGNSYIENLKAPSIDPQISVSKYRRSSEQNESLGICEDKILHKILWRNKPYQEEVLQFNTICDQCSKPSKTKMKVTEIPHFKEVVIMASECDSCGHKTNEVKSGSGIEAKGKKHTLRIEAIEDIARDVLKSETCSVTVPEFELYVGSGLFVGKFTTVEGLLVDIRDDMLKNPFLLGDTTTPDKRQKMEELIAKINEVIDGKLHVDLVLDDPAGNSFVQDIYTPEKDPCLKVEEYERTFEQNEDLGLNDMKTENYAQNDDT